MNREKIWIGIDPGKDGAICAIFESGSIEWSVVPLVGKAVNIAQLSKDISKYKDTNYEAIVALEDVHAIMGAAAKSTFEFGHVVGLIEGILQTAKLPYYKIAPKIWQAVLFRGIPVQKKPSTTGKTEVTNTKAMALHAVSRLFPQYEMSSFYRAGTRSDKIHDGIIDALCMAHYCKTQD